MAMVEWAEVPATRPQASEPKGHYGPPPVNWGASWVYHGFTMDSTWGVDEVGMGFDEVMMRLR